MCSQNKIRLMRLDVLHFHPVSGFHKANFEVMPEVEVELLPLLAGLATRFTKLNLVVTKT